MSGNFTGLTANRSTEWGPSGPHSQPKEVMTNSSCKECAELERELYGVRPQEIKSSNYMRRTCYACGELLEGNYYAVNFNNSFVQS